MNRIMTVLMSLVLLLCFTACGNQLAEKGQSSNKDIQEGDNAEMNSEQNAEKPNQQTAGRADNNDNNPVQSNILIAYFSCTNTTKGIAENIADAAGGKLYEIVAADPYTEDDLKYYTDGRADKEQADPSCRPEISGSVDGMEAYDIVFIGYPLWHGQAPKIIYTFLESYDFSGKTIIPFCTSHSSGIGSSADNLHSLASDAQWGSGERFSSDTDKNTVASWVSSLDLSLKNTAEVGNFDFETKTVLLNSGYEMPVMGLSTYSLPDEECYNSVTALLGAGGQLVSIGNPG